MGRARVVSFEQLLHSELADWAAGGVSVLREVTLEEAQTVWVEFVPTHRDRFQFYPKPTYEASTFLIGSYAPPIADEVCFLSLALSFI